MKKVWFTKAPPHTKSKWGGPHRIWCRVYTRPVGVQVCHVRVPRALWCVTFIKEVLSGRAAAKKISSPRLMLRVWIACYVWIAAKCLASLNKKLNRPLTRKIASCQKLSSPWDLTVVDC